MPLAAQSNGNNFSGVGAWTVLGMTMAQQGERRAALGAMLNAHRFSKDQIKTAAYFTQLAETDPRAPVREVAAQASRQIMP